MQMNSMEIQTHAISFHHLMLPQGFPYSSQLADCFSTTNIHFGGGGGQVQMLDPEKPPSISWWPLKTELMNWNLGFSAKGL